jgi:hypothetical protein
VVLALGDKTQHSVRSLASLEEAMVGSSVTRHCKFTQMGQISENFWAAAASTAGETANGIPMAPLRQAFRFLALCAAAVLARVTPITLWPYPDAFNYVLAPADIELPSFSRTACYPHGGTNRNIAICLLYRLGPCHG